jgi:hypothetical protein
MNRALQFLAQQLLSVFVLPILSALMLVPLGNPAIRGAASTSVGSASILVWILPSILFIGVFAWEWVDFGLSAAVAAFFFPAKPQVGRAGRG